MNLTDLQAAVAAMTEGPWATANGDRQLLYRLGEHHRGASGGLPWETAAFHEPADAAGIVALRNAAPALIRLAVAAQNLSDRRTLDSDGFWVSRKEMRALDNALTEVAAGMDRALAR